MSGCHARKIAIQSLVIVAMLGHAGLAQEEVDEMVASTIEGPLTEDAFQQLQEDVSASFEPGILFSGSLEATARGKIHTVIYSIATNHPDEPSETPQQDKGMDAIVRLEGDSESLIGMALAGAGRKGRLGEPGLSGGFAQVVLAGPHQLAIVLGGKGGDSGPNTTRLLSRPGGGNGGNAEVRALDAEGNGFPSVSFLVQGGDGGAGDPSNPPGWPGSDGGNGGLALVNGVGRGSFGHVHGGLGGMGGVGGDAAVEGDPATGAGFAIPAAAGGNGGFGGDAEIVYTPATSFHAHHNSRIEGGEGGTGGTGGIGTTTLGGGAGGTGGAAGASLISGYTHPEGRPVHAGLVTWQRGGEGGRGGDGCPRGVGGTGGLSFFGPTAPASQDKRGHSGSDGKSLCK